MSDMITKGTTGNSVRVFIADSTVNNGNGRTGLTAVTAGLEIYYSLGARGALTQITPLVALGSLTAAWSSGGFIEASAANADGVYRLDLPNAAVPAPNDAVNTLYVHVKKGATWASQPLAVPLLEPAYFNNGMVDANVMNVRSNPGGLIGNGTPGNPWNPAP